MKKKLFLDFVQYIFAVVAVALTVAYIFAFDKGVLPFMDESYLYLREEGNQEADVSVPVVDDNNESEAVVITADAFVASLPQRAEVLYTGMYDSATCRLVSISLVPVGNIGAGSLELRMGYLHKKDAEGTVVSVYSVKDGVGDIGTAVGNAVLQNLRDGEGNPVFYLDGGFFCLKDGVLKPTEYDGKNFDKGVSYYPSYYSGSDSAYTLFSEGESWGMKAADGTVIVPAEYADVYGASEGRIIAVDASAGVDIYSTDGTLLSDSVYTVPTEAESDKPLIGCYFYRNGYTRAYKDEKSVLVDKDGNEANLPSGFEVAAYSDGIALLKQSYTDRDGKTTELYGYMTSAGKWITTPDYTDAAPFYEGLAAVCGTDGKWGMIDTEGNVVIPMVFDSISNCQDGAILAYESKYGNCVFGKEQK